MGGWERYSRRLDAERDVRAKRYRMCNRELRRIARDLLAGSRLPGEDFHVHAIAHAVLLNNVKPKIALEFLVPLSYAGKPDNENKGN